MNSDEKGADIMGLEIGSPTTDRKQGRPEEIMRAIFVHIFPVAISLLLLTAASVRDAAAADIVRATLKNGPRVAIAGDVNPEKALSMVKCLSGGIPPRPVPPRLKSSTIHLETDLPYGLAVVAYRLPGCAGPDLAAGQVLADVLDSQRGNLYVLAAEGKALFAGFSNSTLPEAGLGYALAGYPKGGNGAALVTALKKVIANYVKNGVPADLVEASKRHEIANAEFRKNSIISHRQYSDRWVVDTAYFWQTSPFEKLSWKGVLCPKTDKTRCPAYMGRESCGPDLTSHLEGESHCHCLSKWIAPDHPARDNQPYGQRLRASQKQP